MIHAANIGMEVKIVYPSFKHAKLRNKIGKLIPFDSLMMNGYKDGIGQLYRVDLGRLGCDIFNEFEIEQVI